MKTHQCTKIQSMIGEIIVTMHLLIEEESKGTYHWNTYSDFVKQLKR